MSSWIVQCTALIMCFRKHLIIHNKYCTKGTLANLACLIRKCNSFAEERFILRIHAYTFAIKTI